MQLILVLTTTPGVKVAKKISAKLIQEKLAACVSMKEGFVSQYSWKGKTETSKETLLLIKSANKNFSKIKKTIQAMHPYDVPEIISLPISGASPDYLSWVMKSIKGS